MKRTRKPELFRFVVRNVVLVALFLVHLGLPTASRAQDSPHLAYAAAVRLHSGPSVTSRVVGVIPAGSRVAVGDCNGGWCDVLFRGQHGYSSARLLRASAPQRVEYSGSGYTNSRGYTVPSPARTSDNQSPPGACAQCGDGTYSFSMSRRGTCSHHGGVSRWLR